VYSSTSQAPSDGSITIGVRAIMQVAIWWLYFKYSKRVRETFGRNI
jgi:hypothetical protein